MPRLLRAFLPGLLALAVSAGAQGLNAEQVLKKLLKAQDAQVSMDCQIVRSQIPVSGGETTRVTGSLKVASGGKALLVIKKPSPQKVVSDGKVLWMEMSDVKQVMKYDALQLREGGNFFLDLASSVRHYAKASLKRLILPGEGFDEASIKALELMPTNPKEAGFDRMQVWVDTNDWVVRQVTLVLGGMENRVRFERISVERDPKKAPSSKIFKYSPPKGYQVFDLISMQ
jgi:outer membrane lipoprotein-sorting protein